MDSFYQITITKGKVNENGEKVDVITLLDNLTRLPDEEQADYEAQALLQKVS